MATEVVAELTWNYDVPHDHIPPCLLYVHLKLLNGVPTLFLPLDKTGHILISDGDRHASCRLSKY